MNIRLIAYIVAAVLLSGALFQLNRWHNAYKEAPALKAAKAAAEKDRLAQIEQSKKDSAKSIALSAELAALRGKEAEIVTKIVSVPRKELVYVKVPGDCPTRSDSYRLLYNEAVTGSASPPPSQ
jgi:hypothetical protein